MRFSRLVSAIAAAVLATIAVVTHAADPLPDRRAVRPGAASTDAEGGSSRSDMLLDLITQLEAVQQEVRQLRGLTEEQAHEIEQLKTRNRDAMADFDRRLRDSEARQTGSPAPAGGLATAAELPVSRPASAAPVVVPRAPVAAPTPAAPVPVVTSVATISAGEQQEYDTAFGYMKQGMYDRASKEFKGFLDKRPRSALAGNAQYWLGEALYAIGNYKQALVEFQKVSTDYPDSPKVADAMLKIGYSQYELGGFDQARATLNQVIARFPQTRAAKTAEERLARIAKEKH